jgi:predicted DNA-binding protein
MMVYYKKGGDKMKTSEKKKTEIRMDPAIYERIYNLVYIKKRFKSLNEAYEKFIEHSLEFFENN